MILPTHSSLPSAPDDIAADGCEVRRLGRTSRGSVAQFQLPAGTVGRAIVHRQVEEIWYIVSGCGEAWWQAPRSQQEIITLAEGMSLTIPAMCSFQLRAGAEAPLVAIAMTMPPWPGADEVTEVVGPWTPTVEAG